MKYYVTVDLYKELVIASTPYQACMHVVQNKIAKTNCGIEDDFCIVSQRGFEVHDDDILIESDIIWGLVQLNLQYVLTEREEI